jgi:hypothetical protein
MLTVEITIQCLNYVIVQSVDKIPKSESKNMLQSMYDPRRVTCGHKYLWNMMYALQVNNVIAYEKQYCSIVSNSILIKKELFLYKNDYC